ncbi:MAG: gliding motility-associated C-terminal domain-containing protein [Chitinophagaceae bacterium]
MAGAEICGNKTDDNGNDLADEKDFICYYDPANNYGCAPSKIIWGCSGPDLYWGDTETGTSKYVGNMNGLTMYDITWGYDGKLYGINNGDRILWEINPNTAKVTMAGEFTDYYGINAMTSDAGGNIYIAGISFITGKYGIGKLNIATMQITTVVEFADDRLRSAGDLCFISGRLYLSCQGGKLAVINPGSGTIEVSDMIGAPTEESMGLISMGDGYLYICKLDKIYKLDPSTGKVDATPFFDFHSNQINFSGLSNYAESCNAPECKATLSIITLSDQPYCTGRGVVIKGKGNGIRGDVVYEWISPKGDTVRTNELRATTKGMYYLKYYGLTDFCGAKDSVFLDIAQSPQVDLGNDKILCEGTTIELIPQAGPDNINFSWRDGSTEPIYSVTVPGEYSIEVSNTCGYARDTLIVLGSSVPKVFIGADTAICPGSGITLSNAATKQSWDTYRWPDLSTGIGFTVNSPGIYWLESSNSCGVTKDSVLISFKDSCSCFPFYPAISLGQDLEICHYETANLSNAMHRDGFHYNWVTGSRDQNLKVKEPGIYWVDVSTYCGMLRDSVIINPKLAGCERNVFIPSAFTPNSDGRNDLFRPVIYGSPDSYEFTVYNRWGQLVFFTKDIKKGWDGKWEGAMQHSNVFVWSCRYKFSGESVIVKNGTVALIR